jgi:two-component system sensor histidine kinase MprB
VAAAAIAVIIAGFASFLTTRSAILHSVDVSLKQASLQPRSITDDDRVTGSYSEIVLPSGKTMPPSNVKIDAAIMNIAKGEASQLYRTVVIDGQSYREFIVPLPKDSFAFCQTEVCQIPTTSAELYIVNITGQVTELGHLETTLMLVASGGLLLALGLGLFLARQALHPLEEVTNEIESVALTNDLQYRLAEGGGDELGRLRRVFNRLLRSVESSQTLQRQLVLDASHELRTPLTSLRTNAQVLSRAPDLSPDELHQITDDMVTQVDELAALVSDLGELARGEKSEGELETLRLDDCVDECVETARTYARIRDITIDVEIETSLVQARHDRLNRAISNLLTNAVKFTPMGGRIMVKTSHGTVTVADSGDGISDEDREHVFDRFWRSPSARSLPGSGLGLSIVAQVVAEIGGTVAVDRDPSLGGARFTISVPETY